MAATTSALDPARSLRLPPHGLENSDIAMHICEFLRPREIACLLRANNSYKGKAAPLRAETRTYHFKRSYETMTSLPSFREMQLFTSLESRNPIPPNAFAFPETFCIWVNSVIPKLSAVYRQGPRTLKLTRLADAPDYNQHFHEAVIRFACRAFPGAVNLSLSLKTSATGPETELTKVMVGVMPDGNGRLVLTRFCDQVTYPVFALALLNVGAKLRQEELNASLQACFTKGTSEGLNTHYADAMVHFGAEANLPNLLIITVANCLSSTRDHNSTSLLRWCFHSEDKLPPSTTRPRLIEVVSLETVMALGESIVNRASVSRPQDEQLDRNTYDHNIETLINELHRKGGKVTFRCIAEHALGMLLPGPLSNLLALASSKENLASDTTAGEIANFLKGSDRSSPRSWAFGRLMNSIGSFLVVKTTELIFHRSHLTIAREICCALTPQVEEIIEYLHKYGAVFDKTDPLVAKSFAEPIDEATLKLVQPLLSKTPSLETLPDTPSIMMASFKYLFHRIDQAVTKLTAQPSGTATTAAATLPPKK
jgi:hypothetical protein